MKHRGARNRKGDYFGPFASVWAVNRTLNALQRAFLLRSCSDSYFENRTRPVPALSDQALLRALHRRDLRMTIMPNWSREARDFLSGKSRAVRDLLADGNDRSRRGARIRARGAAARPHRRALRRSRARKASIRKRSKRRTSSPSPKRPGSSASRSSSSAPIRTGATAPIFRAPTRASAPAEVLDAFLAQFYADKPAARLVLLSHEIEDRELLERALCRARRPSQSRSPCRSAAKRENSSITPRRMRRETLGRKLAEARARRSCWRRSPRPSASKTRCGAIEVYDNSHIMGTNAVGAMIVAGPDGLHEGALPHLQHQGRGSQRPATISA